jgi:hypothetical protein
VNAEKLILSSRLGPSLITKEPKVGMAPLRTSDLQLRQWPRTKEENVGNIGLEIGKDQEG